LDLTKCERELILRISQLGDLLDPKHKRVPFQLAAVLIPLIWGSRAVVRPNNILRRLTGTNGYLVQCWWRDGEYLRVISLPPESSRGCEPEIWREGWLENLVAHSRVGERNFIGRPHDYATSGPGEPRPPRERRLVETAAEEKQSDKKEETGPSRKVKTKITQQKLRAIMADFAALAREGHLNVNTPLAKALCENHLPDRRSMDILRLLQRRRWLDYDQKCREWSPTREGLAAARQPLPGS
jgi:hypothetical protein